MQYNIKKKEEQVEQQPQEEPNPLMRKKKTPEELAAEAEQEDLDDFTSKFWIEKQENELSNNDESFGWLRIEYFHNKHTISDEGKKKKAKRVSLLMITSSIQMGFFCCCFSTLSLSPSLLLLSKESLKIREGDCFTNKKLFFFIIFVRADKRINCKQSTPMN